MKTFNKLYKHQQDLLDLNPKKYLMSWGTGSGKTLMAVSLAKNNDQTAIVICPKSLVDQWKPQVPEDWLVISKEQFKKKLNELKRYNCIIVDEAHYFSNYKSKLTKSLLAYVKNYSPEYIYLLTATPYLSTSWNIYTYGLILGRNWKWFSWNKKFFYKVRMGPRMIPMPKAKIDGIPLNIAIKNLVNQLGGTISLEECFDVPEQIYQQETFALTAQQEKAIEDNFDPLPIVNFTKQHQICGGSLKSDGYVPDAFYKSEKLIRVLELISEHKKLIVVCRYNNEIDNIASKIKNKEVLIIRGDIKDRHVVCQRAESLDDVVVLVQSACSEGYELPSFPLMVFYSYDFALKNYIQILGRIQRAGHIKKNVYLSLYVKGTIDEKIWDTVANKKMDFQIELYEKS